MNSKKKTIITLCVFFIYLFTSFDVFTYYSENLNNEELNEKYKIKKIEIKAEQIQDECIMQLTDNSIRKAEVLLDEQEKIPDYPDENLNIEALEKINRTTWEPVKLNWVNSISAYIDLKNTYKITHIAFLDENGEPEIEFLQGTPFNWKSIFKQKLDSYRTWKCIEVENVETRYIQIKTDNKDSGISEIAFYGYPIEEREEEQQQEISIPNFNITMDEAIGVNGFIDDRLSEIQVAGHIREYHNLRWTLDDNGRNRFTNGNWWYFDDYYKMLHEANIEIIPCIQGTAKYILKNTNGASMNEKAVDQGKNSYSPEAYRTHSSTLYQYAARYGSTKVDEEKLLLTDDQIAKSGLGYIKYYENWNEPDKTWEGEKSYYSPYELAAMCSADYDGHEGTLGDTYGIKNADKNAKLVMGGLCNSSNAVNYLNLMKLWFENNRQDKKMAFDVINFHTYCGTKNPESTGLKERAEDIVEWRNKNASDKEVWITEFGWDTNSASGIAAPSYEMQGNWLVRSYLILSSAGVDRSSMYMLRDAGDSTSTGKYATTGLTTKKGEWNKKTSWYYVYTLKNILKDNVFDKIIEENDNLYWYQFKNQNTNEICYAIWSPTDSKIEQYTINLKNVDKVTITKLKDKSIEGEKKTENVVENKIAIDIGASPIFIQFEEPEENKPAEEQPQEPEENKPAEEQPQEPEENKPVEEQPQEPEENKPVEEQPQESEENKPVEEQPQESEENKPVEEQPQKPEENKPAEKQPQEKDKHKTIKEQSQELEESRNQNLIQVDDTVSNKKLPKTGKNANEILIGISIIVLGIIVIKYIMYTKNN